MVKKLITGFIAILLATSSFGAYKAMYKKKKKQTKKTTATAAKPAPVIKSVLMGRSACFGKCPVYTIEVFETGMLRYTGKSFVDYEGVYEKGMGKEQAARFINEFRALRPDTLKYLYDKRIPDLPGVYYFITYPDSVQKVLNADSGPEFLREWARKFDAIGKADNTWRKIPATEQK